MTYEEANWAKLSPKFREAHNKLRVARGMAPIPEPKKDLWVQPRAPVVKPYDFSDPEFIAVARSFERPLINIPGNEGFSRRKA